MAAAAVDVPPISSDHVLPDAIPSQIAGAPIAGFALVAGGVATYAYSADYRPGVSRSAFLKQGGLLLDVTPGVQGLPLTEGLMADATPGRLIETTVGSFPAVVSWADPDASGLRPHHVIWSDAATTTDFNLVGDRAAVVLLNAARSFACSQRQ
jgi:hypothetical protein